MSTFLDSIIVQENGTLGTPNDTNLIELSNGVVRINGALITNGDVTILDAEAILDDFTYFKNWISTKSYSLNEPVFYQGSPYKSLIENNINNLPDVSPLYWTLTGGGSGTGGDSAGFSSPVQFDSGVDEITLYKDAAQATPEDGTGGTALYITKSLDSSTPLIGTGSLVLSKSANNAQGEGASVDFTIDRGQVTSTAQVSFCYETSANYADGDMGVYVYDVTNGVILYPSIVNLPSTYGKPSNHLITFIPTTSNSYRLIFHVQSTSALAYTVKVDNVQVGNKDVAIGAAVGNWVEYTPTLTGWTLGNGSQKFMWKRDGSDLLLKGYLVLGSTSVMGGLSISLPPGLTLGPDVFNYNRVGSWAGYDSSAMVYSKADSIVAITNSNILQTSPISTTYPFIWATGDELAIYNVRVPISQWTSNVNLTSDFQEFAYNTSTTDAEDTTSFGYGLEGSLIPNITGTTGRNKRVKFQRPIQNTDTLILEVYDPTYGKWLNFINRVAPYARNGAVEYGNRLTIIDNYTVNVLFGGGGYESSGGTFASTGSQWSTLYSAGWKWRVRKISNGNMAEVPPTVRAEYGILASTVQIGTSGTIINFHNRIEDTHNAVTTGASWKFTAPIDGVYSILGFSEAPPATTNFGTSLYECYFRLHKNGSPYGHIGGKFTYTGATVGGPYGAGGSFGTTIRLKAGDYIHVTFDHTSGLFASAAYVSNVSRITITRLGS